MRNANSRVVAGHFDGPNLGLDLLDQGDNLVFLGRIATVANRLATFGLDLTHQLSELVTLAPGHAGDETFTGKSPGNGATGRNTRTKNQCNFFVCRHWRLPCSITL